MPLSTPPERDRIRGCLLGLAVGDALGAPLEGLSPQQVRAHYGTVRDYVDGARAWKRKPYRWRLPGLYTDDTQQALALVDVMLERGAVDPDRLAAIYLALATPRGQHLGAHRGSARSFRSVIEALDAGRPPLECGQPSVGSGAAMRIAPVAIHFAEDAESRFHAVLAASLMTHRDIRSLAGAVAVTSGVHRLLRGEERTPSLLLRVAADVAAAERRIAEEFGHVAASVTEHGHALSTSIANVEAILDLPRADALRALVHEANRQGPKAPCKSATQGFAPACIPTCFYLLLTTRCFEEALIEVVNLGGDADTTGAILGAMAGVHEGPEAIPDRWLAGLINRDGIEQRAEALADGSASKSRDLPDLVETEWSLTTQEDACRDELLFHIHQRATEWNTQGQRTPKHRSDS